MAEGAIRSDASGRWTGYQYYVLAVLILVSASNYIDRGIVSILQEPIKAELGLTDFQLGMISGPAFGLLYTLSSLPMARWAERGNRSTILTVAVTVWSGATALCGLAANYAQLFLSRLLVGLGEGGCGPTTYSLVSDYFPARQRGMAMSALSTAIPIAQLMAPIIGGVVAQNWGWRMAFVAVGVPGLLLAVLLKITIREPRNASAAKPPKPGRLWPDLRLLAKDRALVLFFLANAFMGMAIGGTNAFTATYFIREFGMSLKQAGVVIAIGLGLAGLIGTFVGGYLSDRFAGDKGRSYLYIPGIGAGLAGIFFLITFTREAWPLAMTFLIMANLSTDLKNGTVLAAAQNMSPPHMRATTASVHMIAVTLFGTSIGPLIVGGISDMVATSTFPAALGSFAQACPGGKGAPACAAASAAGIGGGLASISVVYFLASAFFILSGRSVKVSLRD